MGPLSSRRTRAAPGFTLIEVLVVVAILAIAAGAATLVLERDERGTVVREARRFAGALEYAAARARMRGETIGVSAGDGGARFWVLAPDGRWTPLAGDDALAPRAWTSPVSGAALVYRGRAVDADAIVPLRPSGRNDPFAFALATPHWQVLIAADPVNRVTIADAVALAP